MSNWSSIRSTTIKESRTSSLLWANLLWKKRVSPYHTYLLPPTSEKQPKIKSLIRLCEDYPGDELDLKIISLFCIYYVNDWFLVNIKAKLTKLIKKMMILVSSS